MLKRPRRSARNVQRGPGLFVLRSLPDEVMAEIKRHLSCRDWECFQAACRLPPTEGPGRRERCFVKIGDGTRQERALLSDPLAGTLLVAVFVEKAGRRILQKLQSLSNLKYLRLCRCGSDVPIRCGLPFLKTLNLSLCVIDAAGCPAIPTLTMLTMTDSTVILHRSGQPFPLVSRDAHSLEVLQLNCCVVFDFAGAGDFHIDAPRLASLELRRVKFHTENTTCSLAGPQGLAPSLLSAVFDRYLCTQVPREDTLLADAFRRQVVPQLTCLELLYFTPGYLPSALPFLRELVVGCPGGHCSAVRPCSVRDYPVGITKLTVSCFCYCPMDQVLQGVSAAVKAGLQLRELVLSAERHSFIQVKPWALLEASFLGLGGKLEKLTLQIGTVAVAFMLHCLQGCSQLTHVKLEQFNGRSREHSIGVCQLEYSSFQPLSMPALQMLVIPMSLYSFDLQACPQLHTVHITNAFDFQIWSWNPPPMGHIIVSLRTLSQLFKMPRKGTWASPKVHFRHAHGHWHTRESFMICQICSPIHTIQLEPSSI